MSEKEKTTPHMTVGDLRKAIKGLPTNAPVYVERIHDMYFDKHGWETKNKGEYENHTEYIRAWGVARWPKDKSLYIDCHF